MSPHERLSRELRGVTWRRAAEMLLRKKGADHSFLHRVAAGDYDPHLALAVAIERELGIPVEDWPSLRGPVRELLKMRGAA